MLSNYEAISQAKTIELGVSYDQQLVDKVGSEIDVQNYISLLIADVNCIYLDLNPSKYANFEISAFRKIDVNTPSTVTSARRLAATRFWYYQQDLCNKVDAAIHITGLDLIVDDGQSSGGVCELTLTGGVSIAEFQGNQDNLDEAIRANATIIAHELGHLVISSSHESEAFCGSNFSSGLMCDTPTRTIPCDKYVLSPSFFLQYQNGLDRTCIDVQNVDVVNSSCPNCSDFVVITNQEVQDKMVEFGCTPSDNNYDITTSISNNCSGPRSYKVEIFYNDKYVEFLDLDDNFTAQPFQQTQPNFNAKYGTEWELLDEGEGALNMGAIKIKGTGLLSDNTNSAAINIVYTIDPPAKIKDPKESVNNTTPMNIKSVFLVFRYNHQIDLTNQDVVKASEITHDNPFNLSGQEPLDFCSHIKYDIYIDGIFEVDINQSYCNTNFYFGPNAKVIVNSGNTLTLNNCIMTTCGNDDLWQGIELASGGHIFLDKTKIEKATIGIFAENATSSVGIQNQSSVVRCNAGVKLKNTSLFPLKNSTFANNQSAINLTNCPVVNADKCTFTTNTLGINALNTNVISNSDFSGNSTSKGIVHNGDGAQELFVPYGKFQDMNVGITSNNGRLTVGSTSIIKPRFIKNFIGAFKGASPGLLNTIKASMFDENEYGIQVSNNSLGQLSYINGQSLFRNNKYGVSVSNSSQGKGWQIYDNTFEVPFVGVKTSRSDKVDVDDNTFIAMPNSRFASAKDMVVIEGGRDNKVHDNTMSHLSNSSESAQMRNIYVANASNTQVHCNILNHGTYGLNVWGAAPSLISANTLQGSHTGMYYGLYPNNGNVATGVQNHHGNIWEKNPPFLSSYGAKHLGTIEANVNVSRFVVDEVENPKFNTNESAITDWIQNIPSQATSNDCNNPPLSGTTGNAGGNTGSGSSGGSGAGGTMALSIANGDVPFTDYSVPLNQALDQQLYTSILNGDNTGLNTNQISTYTSTMSNTLVGTLAQANYLMFQPIASSTQISTFSDQLNTLMEAYYTAETNNDPSASTIRSQINSLSATLSSAYGLYRTNLCNRIDQVQVNISPLLTSTDPYIHAQSNVMKLALKLLKGDSLNQIDIAKLTQIANMCPLEGGEAVYGAREMVDAHLLTDISYNDHQLCTALTPRSNTIKEIAHTIYPNPSTGFVNITNAQSILEIVIIDAFNRTLRNVNQNINDKSDYQLNLADLSSGIFYLKLINHDLTSSVHKIVIVK